MRGHVPYGTEVGPLYGEIEDVGFPCYRRRALLLVVEEDEDTRYWILYILRNNSWVLARVFQVQLRLEDDDGMEESSVEGIEAVGEE